MIRYAEIYHNGKRLDLEVTEYKTLFKCEVTNENKWYSHIGTLRVNKYKGVDYTKAVEIFKQMCITNKWY